MKKGTWIISLTAFCLTVLIVVQSSVYHKNTQAAATHSAARYILNETIADIDGDGYGDQIKVFGKKNSETDEYAEEINISVTFSGSGFTKKTNDTILSGKTHELHICDFTGDGKSDIMITVPDSDTENTITAAIFDFSHSIPENIFSSSDNLGAKITMKYSDDFIINATLNSKQNFSINLKKRADELIKNGIYTSEHKPTGISRPIITRHCALSVADKDGDGIYSLIGSQNITDINGTILCKVTSYLEYASHKWNIYKIEYSYEQS